MRIEYAIPALSINPGADGITITGVPAYGWVMEGFPAGFDLPLLVCFIASPDEANFEREHRFTARVLDPGLVQTGESFDEPVGIAPGPNTPEGWQVRKHLPVRLPVLAEVPGTYSVDLAVDGGETYSIPIIVFDRAVHQNS